MVAVHADRVWWCLRPALGSSGSGLVGKRGGGSMGKLEGEQSAITVTIRPPPSRQGHESRSSTEPTETALHIMSGRVSEQISFSPSPFLRSLFHSLSLFLGKGGCCPFRAFFPIFCSRSLQEEFCPRTSDTGVVHSTSELTKRLPFFQLKPSFPISSFNPNQFPQIEDALVQVFSRQLLVHLLCRPSGHRRAARG